MQAKTRIAATCALLSVPLAASAALTMPGNVFGVPTDLINLIVSVINWILGIIALIAVALIIYGGVVYLTSAGDSDKIKSGKATITAAIIGLVIAGIAYAVINVIVTVVLTPTV